MSELTDVNTKLQVIDDKCSQLLEWKAAHSEQHKSISRDIGEMRDCLFGKNPGLVDKVQRLWDNRGNMATWKNLLFGVLRIVIATVIVGTLTWLLLLYKGS